MPKVTSAALALRRRYQRVWWLPGWLFAAMTQLPALLAVAWLVPAFAMLVAGRFAPLPMVIIFIPLALALAYFSMRQLPLSWPRFRPGSADADFERESPVAAASGSRTGPSAKPRRPDVRMDTVLATLVIAVGFAVWEALRHSQQILGTGDPGVYVQYAYWIARHGTVKVPQSLSSFGGQSAPVIFGSYGIIPDGTSLISAYMPGLPLVLAAGVWAHGISGALLAGPAIAGAAVLSFAGLTGRLVGPRWAPVGALVLALALPEETAGRTTLSEPLLQVLLFGGLCLIIDSMVVARRRRGAPVVASASGPGAAGPAPEAFSLAAMWLAGIGGFAFALTVLVWIGSLSFLLPVFPILALMFVARRTQAGPLAMGIFLGAACGLFTGLVLARPYLSTLSVHFRDFGLCAAGFGIVTVLIAPLGFPAIRNWARKVFASRPRISLPRLIGSQAKPGGSRSWRLPSLAFVAQCVLVVLPILVLAGFAARPYVLPVTRGFSDPYVVRYVAALQRLAKLPVDGHQQYYELSFDWVLWYLGVPAVLLACGGAALLGRRIVRAVTMWSSSASAARLWGLVYLLVAWSVVTVLWDPSVLPGQPDAARRLLPVVLPGLILLAVWASCLLKGRAFDLGARRITAGAVGVCCVLAMVIPAFWSSFAPSVSVRHQASSGLSVSAAWRGTAVSQTDRGTVGAADSLCSAIGTNSTVVFVDALTADYFAPMVRNMCGQPAAVIAGAGGAVGAGGIGAGAAGATVPGSGASSYGTGAAGTGSAEVQQEIALIERTGRQPVLLGATQASVDAYGATARQAASLQTRVDPQVLNGTPAGTWPFSYTVWMSTPSGTSIPGY
ncbi:MAG TPA: hypothetical protein VGG75_37800 [Trebonia sp.]|jgi:hypothetical protein